MLQAIAIDDEPIALEVIKTHASKVNFISLQNTFTQSSLALRYLDEHQVDLIFLDIKMPDISGIRLVTSFKYNPMIIFTTAYSEHAVKGFELDAVDYLMKPFSLSRFTKACTKCHELWLMKEKVPDAGKVIYLNEGYHKVKVFLDDILYLKSEGNYIRFQTKKGSIMTRMTFKEAREKLPDDFCQIHRSFIIHSKKVKRVEKKQVIINKYAIPIGNNYSAEFSKSVG